jgi:hypothetical protein
MTPELATVFKRPFKEQVAFFAGKAKNLIGTTRWDDLWQAQHDDSFMVAGAMKADLLTDLYAAIYKVEAEGGSLESFRKDFRAIVERRGWHGWTGEGTPKGEAWRTRVIYRTNMSTAYAAGRWAQLKAAGYPLLVYFHGNAAEPRLQHLGWDGLILPVDHPFWVTHAPPNGWGCSCYVSGARNMEMAVILGGNPAKTLPDGWDAIDPRTGAPEGIDKGWAYAPGASVASAVSEVAKKMGNWPGSIPASFIADLPVEKADELVRAYRSLPSTADTITAWARRVMEPNPDGFAPAPFLPLGPLLFAERLYVGNAVMVVPDAVVARLAGLVTPDQIADLPRLLAEIEPVRAGQRTLIWTLDRGMLLWRVTAKKVGDELQIIEVEVSG